MNPFLTCRTFLFLILSNSFLIHALWHSHYLSLPSAGDKWRQFFPQCGGLLEITKAKFLLEAPSASLTGQVSVGYWSTKCSSLTHSWTEVGRDLWASPSPTLLLKAGSARAGHSGLCPIVHLYLFFNGERGGGQVWGWGRTGHSTSRCGFTSPE